MAFKKMVVHSGTAHADDFYSACIALALKLVTLVERHFPSQQELEDSNILIVDVGCDYNDKNHFDHHQFESGRLDCGFSLLMKHYGYHDAMMELFPWYQGVIIKDCMGRYELANSLDVSYSVVEQLTSPIHEQILREFGRRTFVQLGSMDPLGEIMCRMGEGWLNTIDEFKNLGSNKIIDLSGIKVLDSRDLHYCRDALVRMHNPQVILGNDNFGSGLSLIRIDPTIDFRICKDMDGVKFIHTNGFCLTTHKKDDLSVIERVLKKVSS